MGSGKYSVAHCAQRLSASSEDSPDLTCTAGTSYRCSTPFGIIGRLTSGAGQAKPSRERVLNAFRHHRKTHRPLQEYYALTPQCSTPFGIIGRLTGLCCL